MEKFIIHHVAPAREAITINGSTQRRVPIIGTGSVQSAFIIPTVPLSYHAKGFRPQLSATVKWAVTGRIPLPVNCSRSCKVTASDCGYFGRIDPYAADHRARLGSVPRNERIASSSSKRWLQPMVDRTAMLTEHLAMAERRGDGEEAS
jgi:hypothetical protein